MMSSNYVIPNLLLLLLVWMDRASGTLELCSYGAAGGGDPRVFIAKGGLVHLKDWHVLLENLTRRVFRLAPADTSLAGHRQAMGALLAFASHRFRVNLDGVISASVSRPEPQVEHVHPLDVSALIEATVEPEERDRHQDELVHHAIRHMLLGDWPIAERLLRRSRDIRFDHAATLVWLAWSCLNNPNLPVEQGRRDAEMLVKVAGQLDPDEPQTRAVMLAVWHTLGLEQRDPRSLGARAAHELSTVSFSFLERSPV